MRACFVLLVATLSIGLLPGTAGAVEASPCPPKSKDLHFFAAGTLNPANADSDAFRRKWYARHLRAMSEPSLSCGNFQDVVTYRFLWLRTFSHPIAIRVTRQDGAAHLTAIEMTGGGGYHPGKVLIRTERILSADEWKALEEEIDETAFRQQSARVQDGGFDGSQWIIEGRKNSRYHLVDRWSPMGGDQYELGRFFLKLSKWVIPQDEIY